MFDNGEVFLITVSKPMKCSLVALNRLALTSSFMAAIFNTIIIMMMM
jgi:hypothetical protein